MLSLNLLVCLRTTCESRVSALNEAVALIKNLLTQNNQQKYKEDIDKQCKTYQIKLLESKLTF